MSPENQSQDGKNNDADADASYQSLPPICGQRLKQILKDRGISVPKLATKAHVSPNTIADILKGIRKRESSIQAICKFLNIRRSDIELQTGTRSELEYVIPPPDEWAVTSYIQRPVNTDNGLTIRIAKLEHKHLERIGRGKLYELVHIEYEKRDTFREHVLRHAKVCERLAKLDHISRIRLAENYEVRELIKKSGWWIVDHWIDGLTLRQSLKSETKMWPLSKIQWFGSELLEAIRTLHSVEVIIRELSPDRIYLTDSGIKVTDFELASFAQGTISVSGEWETENVFRAPEVDDRLPKFQSDFFSWGRIMSFILTGNPMAKKISMLSPYPEVQAIIQKCLLKSYKKRPESIDEILVDWHAWKPGE